MGSLAVAAGLLVVGGILTLFARLVPSAPRLDAALAQLQPASGPVAASLGSLTTRSERVGARIYRLSPIPLSPRVQRALRVRGKSVAEFYADKVVMAVLGAVVPAVVVGTCAMLGLLGGPAPVLVAVVGGFIGFFVPNVLVRRADARIRSDAREGLLVYMDLVTLERLANASATQALYQASLLSELPLFVQIRTALERARLEQQPPFEELRRLSEQIALPELGDLTDIMRLDDTGGALSGMLRARVRELRDAHLNREQLRASADAEGMTLYMTIPAVTFGLIFLIAALLRIVGS